MANNDIHMDEQGTQIEPMKAPALTNKETAPQDVSSIQNAVHTTPKNVLDTPKELSTKALFFGNNGPQNSFDTTEDRHRGTVVDPAHDRRLKKNKGQFNRWQQSADVRDLFYKEMLQYLMKIKDMTDLKRKASLNT